MAPGRLDHEIDELLLRLEAPEDALRNAHRLAELFAERERLRAP